MYQSVLQNSYLPGSKMAVLLVIPFMFSWTHAKDVICPNGQFSCDKGSTCCKLTDSQYQCCPTPNAQCCLSGEYCCFSGFKCDEVLRRCIHENATLSHKFIPTNGFYLCSNKKTACLKNSLCCPLNEDLYTCCPYKDYFCCATGCCANTLRDISSKEYLSARNKWNEKFSEIVMPLIEVKLKSRTSKDIICPDGHTTCSVGATCCKLPNEQWGCCPLPSATCCKDRVHCCPSGMKCDSKTGGCKTSFGVISFYHILKKNVTLHIRSVVCPDEHSHCPSNYTCCKLINGKWGCCAYKDAVCCDDHIHCCPNGMICDIEGGKCLSGINTVPMKKKLKAKTVLVT